MALGHYLISKRSQWHLDIIWSLHDTAWWLSICKRKLCQQPDMLAQPWADSRWNSATKIVVAQRSESVDDALDVFWKTSTGNAVLLYEVMKAAATLTRNASIDHYGFWNVMICLQFDNWNLASRHEDMSQRCCSSCGEYQNHKQTWTPYYRSRSWKFTRVVLNNAEYYSELWNWWDGSSSLVPIYVCSMHACI